MRRVAQLITILVSLVLIAASCGDSGDGSSDTEALTNSGVGADDKIAVLLPDSASSARWETDDRRFLVEAFEAAGLSSDQYLILNAEGDPVTMQTLAEQAITDGATVLIMVNLDSGSASAIIDNAHSQGVKVIDYDRLTIEGSGADYYVSFDNEAVGRLMGEAMLDALADFDGVPEVVLLNGGPTDNNTRLLHDGYFGAVKSMFESGAWNLVDDQDVPDWDNVQAQTIFEQILTASGNRVDAAIVANDGMAGGVIAALHVQGIVGIPVTGQDATVGGIQNVVLGDQYMTVYKAIRAEAFAAAEVAVALFKGESPTGVNTAVNNGTRDVPSVLLVPLSVTSANVSETVIADAFRTVAEICVGNVADTEYCESAK